MRTSLIRVYRGTRELGGSEQTGLKAINMRLATLWCLARLLWKKRIQPRRRDFGALRIRAIVPMRGDGRAQTSDRSSGTRSCVRVSPVNLALFEPIRRR